jgi:dolichyl-phosphate-mannose--protein O-mannosyl transferase
MKFVLAHSVSYSFVLICTLSLYTYCCVIFLVYLYCFVCFRRNQSASTVVKYHGENTRLTIHGTRLNWSLKYKQNVFTTKFIGYLMVYQMWLLSTDPYLYRSHASNTCIICVSTDLFIKLFCGLINFLCHFHLLPTKATSQQTHYITAKY